MDSSALWSLSPNLLAAIVEASGPGYSSTARQFLASALGARRDDGQTVQRGKAGAVAVLPLMGVLSHRGTWWGGTSLVQFRQWLAAAVNDLAVDSIVIEVDSGGGDVAGVTELASELYRARSSKRIVAAINGSAGGTAYQIASQASEVYVTLSGQAGGLGIVAIHTDHSGELSKAGIKPTLIASSAGKVEANPYEALSQQARQHLQERVDEAARQMYEDIAKGRGTTVSRVEADYGQGRLLVAERALAARMVDGIRSFTEVLDDLTGTTAGQRMARAQADLELRQRRAAARVR